MSRLIMRAAAGFILALWTAAGSSAAVHRLTVEGGTGGGDYTSGARVVVATLPPPPGPVFSHWRVFPADASLGESFVATHSPATVTMPACDVTLTPSYAASIRVVFDARGGSAPMPPAIGVNRGGAYGALAATSRAGYVFDGWWSGANGTGARVSPETVVTVWSDHLLYANWTATGDPGDDPGDPGDNPDDPGDNPDDPSDDPDPDPVPEGTLCDPVAGEPLAAPGSYDGFFHAADDFNGEEATAVRGTLTLKVSSAAGKLSAKAALQGGNVSFSAKAWIEESADGTKRATLAARSGETLDLFVRQNRIWGTLQGGKAGATPLTLDGGRNRFADRGDAAAAALLEGFKGYYTVALPTFADHSLGDAEAAPAGVGYLAVTVGTKGSAKVAGVFADGTKVSRAGRLILFTDCGDAACVPLFAPLYAKKGWAGGLLWLDPAARTVTTDRDLGWLIRWEKPGRGPDGFRMLLDACGGFYSSASALAAGYLFSTDAGEAAYHHAAGVAEPAAVPDGVAVTVAGARLTVPRAAKPKKMADEEGVVWYDYDPANPAQATLAFAARTGIFKGRFTLWYEVEAGGRPVLKGVKAPYAGILTPLRAPVFTDLPAGMGHCLVPETDPAFKALRLKRSYPVRLEAGE